MTTRQIFSRKSFAIVTDRVIKIQLSFYCFQYLFYMKAIDAFNSISFVNRESKRSQADERLTFSPHKYKNQLTSYVQQLLVAAFHAVLEAESALHCHSTRRNYECPRLPPSGLGCELQSLNMTDGPQIFLSPGHPQ